MLQCSRPGLTEHVRTFQNSIVGGAILCVFTFSQVHVSGRAGPGES